RAGGAGPSARPPPTPRPPPPRPRSAAAISPPWQPRSSARGNLRVTSSSRSASRSATSRKRKSCAPKFAAARSRCCRTSRRSNTFMEAVIAALRARALGARPHRPLALDGRAVHQAALAIIVVDGVVHRAAVVPHREVALAPAQPAGEFRLDGVLVEELEQRPALGRRHALE